MAELQSCFFSSRTRVYRGRLQTPCQLTCPAEANVVPKVFHLQPCSRKMYPNFDGTYHRSMSLRFCFSCHFEKAGWRKRREKNAASQSLSGVFSRGDVLINRLCFPCCRLSRPWERNHSDPFPTHRLGRNCGNQVPLSFFFFFLESCILKICAFLHNMFSRLTNCEEMHKFDPCLTGSCCSSSSFFFFFL